MQVVGATGELKEGGKRRPPSPRILSRLDGLQTDIERGWWWWWGGLGPEGGRGPGWLWELLNESLWLFEVD